MIKDRLLSLPDEIERAKKNLLVYQQDLLGIRSQKRIWELIEMSNIANELDDNGKAVFSNDSKRQAELQHRKEISEDYVDMEQAEKTFDGKVALANIQLEKLLNEQGNLRAICRLEGGLNE